MDSFDEAYAQLNAAQKQAVDAIDGPVLVLAGPGTGKTQLLSARVANILRETDTPAANILCLTFTESGATNMRERLTRFIGQTAYEVTIGTYHAFGGDLIRRYPEYFAATRLQSPVDELGKRQILEALTESMSYTNPLKQTRHHLGDLMGTISELKRALLTPDMLRAIAKENLEFVAAASGGITDIFASFTTMPRSLEKARAYFAATLKIMQSLAPPASAAGQYGSLAAIAAAELGAALTEADETGKTKPLTAWKNTWLAKNADNQFVLEGDLVNRRIRALASVLEHYQSALVSQGLYDFDDMILRAIEALETHDDLRYTLQERYLYILLDEFQDTNAAQLKLIELLTNNPVSEGHPNVMTVGDDDQAIYAFQGAQYSNMLDFYRMYQDVKVVGLTENYRSRQSILDTALAISGQISARLHDHFPGVTKALVAAGKSTGNARIERRDFLSPVAERDWVAHEIKKLIITGTAPRDIAVLAPKHKYLEPLVPYLNRLDIPVSYEKRENILKAPIVEQLVVMSRLVLALEANNQALANHLWPQVLSYDFWQLPTADIWQTAWQVSDDRDGQLTWSRALLERDTFRVPAQLLLTLATKVHTETCETILDYLIGSVPLPTHDPAQPEIRSPLREFYTNREQQALQPDLMYQTVSHLMVLRARLHEYQRSSDAPLMLPDFIRFITMYEEAEQQILNTSPYSQQADSVQLMTVFKAKGLEYEHVFLVGSSDEVWGSSSRDNGNKLTLPPNLQPIRHAGTTEDERLRILYVALTRAKSGLVLTNATANFAGKPTRRLKYLDEREQPDGTFMAMALPPGHQTVLTDGVAANTPELELMELDWRARHLQSGTITSLKGLLRDRLENYQLSPTHLIDFLNIEYCGPQRFFLKTLLRFPETPMPDAQFGVAVHETLEWLQHRTSERGSVPSTAESLQYFRARMVAKHLSDQRTRLEIERGERALSIWMRQRSHIFKPGDVAEKRFKNEGAFAGEAHMSGQIDRMEIDTAAKEITVVDYKTGKPHASWKSDSKLHLYRLQLCCYKLLIENSVTYKDYKVGTGRLEFIEPDDAGKTHQLELKFSHADMELTRQLIGAMWQHVHDLDFPDTSAYPDTLTGIKAFEKDLLEGTA